MAFKIHQKALPSPVEPTLIAVCPTMDLVAAVTAPDQIEVFRLDGHRAFGIKRGGKRQIEALSWRPDGEYRSRSLD